MYSRRSAVKHATTYDVAIPRIDGLHALRSQGLSWSSTLRSVRPFRWWSLRDPEIGPNQLTSQCLIPNLPIVSKRIRPHVAARMLEMYTHRSIANSFAANAKIHQAFPHFAVFAAPLH